jgi:hypothetical protein
LPPRQWLPIDPPRPEAASIGALLAANRSGPRRYGFGTIREHLIGIKVMLADGRIIRSGGKVVKNVAGYDLCKLFVGSRGTLGVIVEATFKVLPQPEREIFVTRVLQSHGDLTSWLGKINEAQISPVILDAYNLSGPAAMVLGFAGTREDVDWQAARGRELGFNEAGSLAYDTGFWNSPDAVQWASVLPSKVSEALESIEPQTWVARVGNGVIYYRGGKPAARPQPPRDLTRRVKDTYDPNRILPELPW